MEHLEKFQTRLARERDRTIEHLQAPASAEPTNEEDVIGQSVQKERQLRLDRIQQAQARLDRGEYGICQTCGQPIAKERLLALPYVERCVECQRRTESRSHLRHCVRLLN